MSFIERKFRLDTTPGGLGLRCETGGLSLAGVSLLRHTAQGFAPRPEAEIAALFAAAYQGGIEARSRLPTLEVIAAALNRDDQTLAMIAALLLKLPALDWDAAARLARASDYLEKYNEEEPRRADGEWTDGDSAGGDSAGDADPTNSIPNDPYLDPEVARFLEVRTPEFEERYDYLGPVEYAEAVTEFGYQLGATARDYSPSERQSARAEYVFLQDRLNFWLGYDFKPPSSQDNIRSAALALYQGAINGGLIHIGDHLGALPPSMLDVAAAAIGNDGVQSTAGLKRLSPSLAGTVPLRMTELLDEVGGIIDNKIIQIKWTGGVIEQGGPWERFLARVLPGISRLLPGSKAFDRYYPAEREAISDKTLNTLSPSYIKNPRRIFTVIKGYVDAAEKYKPRTQTDLDPLVIDKKTIHLAVPDFTSASQWRHVMRAILYAKERKITLVVTRVR